MGERSNRPEVRNPILGLPAMERIRHLTPDAQDALRDEKIALGFRLVSKDELASLAATDGAGEPVAFRYRLHPDDPWKYVPGTFQHAEEFRLKYGATVEPLYATPPAPHAAGYADGIEAAARWHEQEITGLKEQIAENTAYLKRYPRDSRHSDANDYCEAKIRAHESAINAIRALKQGGEGNG